MNKTNRYQQIDQRFSHVNNYREIFKKDDVVTILLDPITLEAGLDDHYPLAKYHGLRAVVIEENEGREVRRSWPDDDGMVMVRLPFAHVTEQKEVIRTLPILYSALKVEKDGNGKALARIMDLIAASPSLMARAGLEL